jgi:uncharacterized membrane protein YqhA
MADFMRNPLRRWFEAALWNSRFVLLVAVAVSVLSAFVLILLVSVDLVGVLASTLRCFSPNLTSEMHDSLLGEIVRKIITVIATLAVFLASDAGKSISGQMLPIDNDTLKAS